MQRELQLDPGESKAMLLKGAKLGFVFPQVWLVHPLQKGRYLHVLAEIVDMLASGKLAVTNIDRFSVQKIASAKDAVSKADGSIVVTLKKDFK